jgi:hypothetical protein
VAALAVPNQLAEIQVSRVVGETFLAIAYHREGDQDAFDKQLATIRTLVASLEKSPPKPSKGGMAMAPWGIPFAIEMGHRELAEARWSRRKLRCRTN